MFVYYYTYIYKKIFVCVCVCERKRERELPVETQISAFWWKITFQYQNIPVPLLHYFTALENCALCLAEKSTGKKHTLSQSAINYKVESKPQMVKAMHVWTSEPVVINPHASSNCLTSPGAYYSKHEKEKSRSYEERIREVEHGTLTPLVFSATGGMGTTAGI